MEPEKTYMKGLGFCGNEPLAGSNAAAVDVKDGKIVRIRPLHFDSKYKSEDMNPWKIKARGKTFEPGCKTLLPPFTLAYKKRVYSPNRIKYPLKRVDWDPNPPETLKTEEKASLKEYPGMRPPKSSQVEIKEDKGRIRTLRRAFFTAPHGETKALHYAHGIHTRLLHQYFRRLQQVAGGGPDSWEGWFWGAEHVWGMTANVGEMAPCPIALKISRRIRRWYFSGAATRKPRPWPGTGSRPAASATGGRDSG